MTIKLKYCLKKTIGVALVVRLQSISYPFRILKLFNYFDEYILRSTLFSLRHRELFFADLSRAQRTLSSSLQNFSFDCIGTSQTDDELVIAKSLGEFGRLIALVEDERDRMVSLQWHHDSGSRTTMGIQC